MAKETRLNDDAQIYQPRDERSEKEKFQSMGTRQKIQYFNQYYRTKLIIGIVIIVFLIYLFYSMFGPKVETVLYAAVLDGCIDSDTVNEFQTDMIERLELDTKKSTVLFDNSFYVSASSDYSSSNQQKLVIYATAGEIDIIIAPEEIFSQYASSGYFTKMSDCLPTDLFSTLTDNFFYYTAEEDTQEAAYGIYLDNYAITDTNGNVISRPVIGILANSEHEENAVSFIESLSID